MSALKLNHAMELMERTYTLQDILDEIANKTMQSFVEGDTWVVTRIVKFPRKTFIDVVMYVGELKPLDALYARVVEFAKSEGATSIRAYCRPGWTKIAARYGWRQAAVMFTKEI